MRYNIAYAQKSVLEHLFIIHHSGPVCSSMQHLALLTLKGEGGLCAPATSAVRFRSCLQRLTPKLRQSLSSLILPPVYLHGKLSARTHPRDVGESGKLSSAMSKVSRCKTNSMSKSNLACTMRCSSQMPSCPARSSLTSTQLAQ